MKMNKLLGPSSSLVFLVPANTPAPPKTQLWWTCQILWTPYIYCILAFPPPFFNFRWKCEDRCLHELWLSGLLPKGGFLYTLVSGRILGFFFLDFVLKITESPEPLFCSVWRFFCVLKPSKRLLAKSHFMSEIALKNRQAREAKSVGFLGPCFLKSCCFESCSWESLLQSCLPLSCSVRSCSGSCFLASCFGQSCSLRSCSWWSCWVRSCSSRSCLSSCCEVSCSKLRCLLPSYSLPSCSLLSCSSCQSCSWWSCSC